MPSTVDDERNCLDSLDIVYQWCNTNDLQLNINKCKSLTFSREKVNISGSYSIGGMLEKVLASLEDNVLIFKTLLS